MAEINTAKIQYGYGAPSQYGNKVVPVVESDSQASVDITPVTEGLQAIEQLCKVIDRKVSGEPGDEAKIIDRSITSYESSTIKVIGSYAFANASKLTKVSFPEATTVGYWAFCDCSALEEVNFPLVESVDQYAFNTCPLSNIEFPQLVFANQSAFRKTAIAEITEKTFPRAITFRDRVFEGCSKLTTVTLPAATYLGISCFLTCKDLATVNLPLVTELQQSCFSGCAKLATVNIPSITKIGQNAFAGCVSLTEVELPSSLSLIDYNAFNNCTSLSKVVVRATTPPSGTTSMFPKNDGMSIYVPDGSVDAYKAATGWSTFADYIKPISEKQ